MASRDNYADSRTRAQGQRPNTALDGAPTHPNTNPRGDGSPFSVAQLGPGFSSVDGEALRLAMAAVSENYKIGPVPADVLARRDALVRAQCAAKAPNFPASRP